MAKSKSYWDGRRKKQGGRFGSRIGKAWDKPSVGTVAKAAWSGVKYLRTMINAETFYYDLSPTNYVQSTTPSVVNMVPIAQGDGTGNRTGNSILLKYCNAKLVITKNATATFTKMRVVMIRDKQQIADTPPVYSDVFMGNGYLEKLNIDSGRFQILFNKEIILSTQRDYQKLNIFWRFKNTHVKYNGPTITDIQKNGIYLLVVSDQAVNTPSVDYTLRTAYYDN